MKQAIVHTYVSTHLKFLRYAFICTSKTDMILLRRVVFHIPRRPANVLELSTAKLMFFFFKMVLDVSSKNSIKLSSTTLMNAYGWMKKIIEK